MVWIFGSYLTLSVLATVAYFFGLNVGPLVAYIVGDLAVVAMAATVVDQAFDNRAHGRSWNDNGNFVY